MPQDELTPDQTQKYALPTKKNKVVQPLHDLKSSSDNPAVNIIRNKIAALYGNEPSAKEELAEAEAIPRPRSKHQQFMHELSTSGKSLVEIQTAWHNYYVNLPDQEKHQVWQEFYANHQRAAHAKPQRVMQAETRPHAVPAPTPAHASKRPRIRVVDNRTVSDLKQQLLGKVNTRSHAKKAHHHKSLVFGVSMGLFVLFIMMFSFFNERFIAPFYAPSRKVSSTPIIVDASTAVGPESKVVIPKINVEIPVIYDDSLVTEAAQQKALEDGTVHYPNTPNPGELGNGVVFGHSSHNILDRGKYKFAFVLLNKMEIGDTFMMHFQGKRYIYRVYEKKIVPPSDISVLGPAAKPASMTLITCDPPGTATNRLIVIGEQITPDPAANVASTKAGVGSVQPAVLPSNAPSLWSKFTKWLTS